MTLAGGPAPRPTKSYPPVSVILFRSRNATTFDYIATIARAADFPTSLEGPNEHDIVALPDRSLPGLMSGRTTTRTIAFARLSHPNQRQLEFLLAPGGRVYANRFVSRGSDGPRPDRFEGPAVVLLPVVSFQ